MGWFDNWFNDKWFSSEIEILPPQVGLILDIKPSLISTGSKVELQIIKLKTALQITPKSVIIEI